MEQNNNIIHFSHLKTARDFEKALMNKPIEEQITASIVAKNIMVGASWEFCIKESVLNEYDNEFSKSRTCRLMRVTYNRHEKIYGYLVHMSMDRLLELLGPENEGPLTEEDVERVKKCREEAILALVNRLKSGYMGKIGIFHTNDCEAIVIQDKVFPAFTLTLEDVCVICEKMGYGIMVGGEVREPMQVLKKEKAVIEALLLAPSSNALFIDIRPR